MEPDHRAQPERVHVLRGVRAAVLPGPHDPEGSRLPSRWWLRIPILLLLGGLAIGFTGGSIAIQLNVFHQHLPDIIAIVLATAQSAPVLLAAYRPMTAWRVSAAGLVAGAILMAGTDFSPWPVTSMLAYTIVLFFVGTSSERETAVGAGAATLAGPLGVAIVVGMASWFALILAAVAATALVFGNAVGERRAVEAQLRVQEELRDRDLARQAILEERARIARELHDVVAHHMSVIALQAEAAPFKIPELPPAAVATFGLVRDAARDALTETRRVVGLLRSEDEGVERAPQPGLDRLDDLAAGARHSGLHVDMVVTGVPRPLDAGVDLSAFRIVQESLSNAIRYAPGTTVRIEVAYGPAALTVTITDTGPRTPVPATSGGGNRGLVGMRERATMLGGTLTAGPNGEGWTVQARLPYPPSA
ncbi:sensor histidine kinase [Actinomadura rayongensis]|uniref:histidine kinase n=1 Tax=Actinomadura rayongensis TaxID=1429076 RepID=A0A6I4W9K9_9ACTN|nr:histidine kinase [Actinomadura rayongensis]MXQ66867.1 sensor histidine kinase [Actinomadura rayongensis]